MFASIRPVSPAYGAPKPKAGRGPKGNDPARLTVLYSTWQRTSKGSQLQVTARRVKRRVCAMVKSLLRGMDGQSLDHHFLGADSFSILFNHGSFQRPAVSPRVLGGVLERRMPGKNGEGTPRHLQIPRRTATTRAL